VRLHRAAQRVGYAVLRLPRPPSAEIGTLQAANKHKLRFQDEQMQTMRPVTALFTARGNSGHGFRKEAGLRVVDARISHLSYAPEIAQSMLRKQQAQQVIAAREQIVQGALKIVSEVCLALDRDNIVKLSEDHKSQLVINLLTVMMSENEAQPTLPLR